MCHEGLDADGPELMGKVFLDRWREDKLEPLFTFIKTTHARQSSRQPRRTRLRDVIAFVLEANGLPAGERELSADMVGSIQLVGPEAPGLLPTSPSFARWAVSTLTPTTPGP